MNAVPENFAKYKVEKVLGEGAMGIVYAGYDPGIGRKVAIKTIHAHLLQGAEGEELRRRFNLEVKAVGKLSHPNIVAIYDTDEISDGSGTMTPYFVMEFVKGRELEHYLEEGARFPLSKTIDIACQILDGFAYTHKLGVIHRDVKPANIFLTDDGQVKIADFGIARVDNASMTQTGAVIGTPNYMSPEQCSGQSLDHRSDLFAIAVVIYELLTGEKPFSANSLHATMLKVVQSNPEPPSAFNPSLPKTLDAVIAKALAKSPDERFQDADAFRKMLEPLKHGGNVDSTAMGQTVVSGRVPAVNKKAGVLWPVISGASLAVLLSAGLAFYWFNDQAGSAGGESAAVAERPDLEAFATDLPLATQEKVERLLGAASKHEDAGRLIFPATSSAYFVYNLVFEMDPGNPRAEYGLQQISERLVEQAEKYYRNRDFETLAAHLQGSLEAFPNNERLRELNRELQSLRADAGG